MSKSKKKQEIKEKKDMKRIVLDWLNRMLFSDKLVVIDLSNMLRHLPFEVFEELYERIKETKPKAIKIVPDANLKYYLPEDALEKYLKYVGAGIIDQAPAGIAADDYVIQIAVENDNVVILTNDCFRDYNSFWIEDLNLIKYMYIDKKLYFGVNLKRDPTEIIDFNKLNLDLDVLALKELVTPIAAPEEIEEQESHLINSIHEDEQSEESQQIEPDVKWVTNLFQSSGELDLYPEEE